MEWVFVMPGLEQMSLAEMQLEYPIVVLDKGYYSRQAAAEFGSRELDRRLELRIVAPVLLSLVLDKHPFLGLVA